MKLYEKALNTVYILSILLFSPCIYASASDDSKKKLPLYPYKAQQAYLTTKESTPPDTNFVNRLFNAQLRKALKQVDAELARVLAYEQEGFTQPPTTRNSTAALEEE